MNNPIVVSRALVLIPALLCASAFSPCRAEHPPGFAPAGTTTSQGVVTTNGTLKASDLIGMTVLNSEDKNLGKVNDLALNLANGRILHLIISTGGVLGVGSTEVAVPTSAFTLDDVKHVLRLETTEQKIKTAPKFELSQWNEFYDSDRVGETHRHFGQEPHLMRMTEEEKAASMVYANVRRDSDGNRLKPMTGNAKHAGRWGDIHKGSTVLGLEVKNLQGETVGKVDNLVVKMSPGRIVAVIVSSGGFLGLGDELSAVPSHAFHFSADHKHLVLDTTKEALAAAPHFKNGGWPEWKESGYAREVHKAYQIETLYDANTKYDADNSSRNKRDREPGSLTPLDQGSSTADVGTTQSIRKAIMAGDSFSTNAQNVKIITLHGKVTLRGPVNTKEEKGRIGTIAEKFAVNQDVDNLLEVIAPPAAK